MSRTISTPSTPSRIASFTRPSTSGIQPCRDPSSALVTDLAVGLAADECEIRDVWARTEFYDIEARAVPSASAEAMHEMARTLLPERFKLRMHRETREVPAYRLVTARKDGRLGPGLTRPAIDCDAYRAAKERGDTLPTDPTRKPFADRLVCATTVMPVFDHTRVIPGADWRLTAGGATIGSLVTLLARDLGRPVIDKTGLTQRFDVAVQYSVELRPGAEPGPPLQAALADQLGLKVEDAKAAVEVLVIDRVERPDPN